MVATCSLFMALVLGYDTLSCAMLTGFRHKFCILFHQFQVYGLLYLDEG